MALRSDSQRWGWVAQSFHWLTALAVIGQATLGWYMLSLPRSMRQVELFALHKSIGITILALVVLRLLWRLVDRRPTWLSAPRWQQYLAHLTHWGLYALLLLMPISGWLFNSASNFPLQWFGLFTLPSLVERNQELKEIMGLVHLYGFWLLAALFALHAAAALKHHFFNRDATLTRMLPGTSTRRD